MIRKPLMSTDEHGRGQVECDVPGKPFTVHTIDRFCEICRADQPMPPEWASVDRRWAPVHLLKDPHVSLHDTLNPHRVVLQVWQGSPVTEVHIIWPNGRVESVKQ